MPRHSVIRSGFFNRPTLDVCRDLLGKQLCRRHGPRQVVRLAIHEVEGYDGFEDRASHAHRGPTPRNAVMFGPPGVWYCYLCYGVHWMANLVAGPRGYPAAILLRGAGEAVGPGRLTRLLAVDRSLDGVRCTRSQGFWLEDDGTDVPDGEVALTPRIGIHYAPPEWVQAPYRFVWTGHPARPTNPVATSR